MAFLKTKFCRNFEFLGNRNMLSRSNSWAVAGVPSDLDSDCEGEGGCSEFYEVSEGCIAMYVGEQRQRFVVATELLRCPFMKRLLDRSAEEYGFEYNDGLTIPCEPVLFEHLLWLLRKDKKQAAKIQIDELLDFYHDC